MDKTCCLLTIEGHGGRVVRTCLFLLKEWPEVADVKGRVCVRTDELTNGSNSSQKGTEKPPEAGWHDCLS